MGLCVQRLLVMQGVTVVGPIFWRHQVKCAGSLWQVQQPKVSGHFYQAVRQQGLLSRHRGLWWHVCVWWRWVMLAVLGAQHTLRWWGQLSRNTGLGVLGLAAGHCVQVSLLSRWWGRWMLLH